MFRKFLYFDDIFFCKIRKCKLIFFVLNYKGDNMPKIMENEKWMIKVS